MKVTIIANSSWYIFNFRSRLIKKLLENGYKVNVIAPVDEYSKRIKQMNVNFIDWNLDSSSLSFYKEPISFLRLIRILKKNQTNFIFSFTPKVNIYTGLSLYFLKIMLNFFQTFQDLEPPKILTYFLKKVLLVFIKSHLKTQKKYFSKIMMT